MKSKTLKKKIRRLETRLLEGPKKLAKWKRKLAALLASDSDKARKKLAAKTAGKRRSANTSRTGSQKKRSTAAKRPVATKPTATPKVKKTRNLSPERRAQLSAAMKARWAAKRAGTTAASSPSDQGFQVIDAVQSSENSPQGV